MELEISTLMMLFFLLALSTGMWKIYFFFHSKEPIDEERTQESQEELLKIVLHVIKSNRGELSSKELFEKVKEHSSFDKKRFSRFNHNRLNLLLAYYHLKHPHTKNITDIYEDLK